MENKVKTVLEPHNKKKIILSVSGGIDSIVLLDILMKIKKDLVVVHFNHQQREQSKIEANYLRNFCKEKGIPFEYFLLNISENKNFQSAAGSLRKKHLITTAKKYHTDVIVTAHQLNDLAETIILKLSRGSNLLGYSGMQQSYYKYKMHFLKPLLYVSKEEIIHYSNKNNLTYFEDESNYSSKYTRNKIRHFVIPYLLEDNPAFLKKIIDYNKSLTSAFRFIRKMTIQFLNSDKTFLASEFVKLDEAIQTDVVAYLLEEYNSFLTKQKITMIVDFILTSGPNATIDIGAGLQFKKEYDKVAIVVKENNKTSFKQKLNLDSENILENGDVIIFNNNLKTNNNNMIVLCYNKLVLPLYARTRNPGDTLSFSFGHKKLKDFYIDNKVPLAERDKDILIVDKNDEILAVLGRYINNNKNLKDRIELVYRRKENDF